MSPATSLALLHQLRGLAGPALTTGLADAALAPFLSADPLLSQAITEAIAARRALEPAYAALVEGPEEALISSLQAGFLNFYEDDAVNPYVPLAARGPWIVTSHGAVLHDSGGYGMLGFGHAPQPILDALHAPWVMANVMTPSVSHLRLTDALQHEIGHTRGRCPFERFLCVNSGSESVTVGARISDVNAGLLTGPGGRHEGRRVKFLAIEGGFHGRTDRPAQASGSSRPRYQQHLASFRSLDNLVLVPANNCEALRAAFAAANEEGVFFELMLMEPVMGEGSPGTATTRAFYDLARSLTRAHGALLLVDSIQAGLRAHGVLSIVDYPGFQDAEAPDLETWSKAINGGQFPLSVLGLSAHAAGLYRRGVYGNTMTGNPRGAEAAVATLAMVTPSLRRNVAERGAELLAGLEALRVEFPELIVGVQGTGLLLAAEIDPALPVVGPDGLERWLRVRGLGVIHGGRNALRFTPHFRITSAEVAMVLALVRDGLLAVRASVGVAAR
jgi:acetylornithine/succinyldiaminopimelate/putrescine aminotransferase